MSKSIKISYTSDIYKNIKHHMIVLNDIRFSHFLAIIREAS